MKVIGNPNRAPTGAACCGALICGLDRRLKIRLGEIIAYIEQRTATLFRKSIGETVSKIQPRSVDAFSPLIVGLGDSTGPLLRNGDDSEA